MARTAIWAPFAAPDFRRLWTAIFISNIGYWMQTVAAAWLMRQWTGNDPVMVSLIQTALFLPAVLILLPAGALADLLDRRRYMMFSQGWMALAALALAAMILLGLHSPIGLLALLALLAVGFALNMPVQSAIWPELVPRHVLPQAVSLYSISNNGARLIGPALAGAVLPLIGAATVVALNGLSTLGVIAVLLMWRRSASQVARAKESGLALLAGGLRFAAGSRTFRAVLLRGGAFFIVTSIILALLPVKVTRPEDFGTVFSFFGLGAVAGALSYGRVAARFSRNRIVAVAIAVHAFCLFGLSANAQVPVMSVLTGGIGFAWFFVMSAMQIGSQMVLPDALRGRGLALLNLVLMTGYALGSPLWGFVAARSSADSALRIAATISLAVLALTLRMRLPEDADGEAPRGE